MDNLDSKEIGKRPREFEHYIIGWMKKLGFKDVDGGTKFVINGIQLDACGGHEDNLIIVECPTPGKRKQRPVRDDINKIRESIPILKKGFKSHPKYNKYNHLVFAIALKNIIINDQDLNFAQQGHKIYVWDEQTIEYYEELSKIIGEYARFSFLGELGIQPRIESQIKYPSFKCNLDRYTAYIFMAEPDKLLRVAYVARREVGNEKYYQRILKRERLANIERFVRKGGIFPNNIILSFQKAPLFTPLKQEWLDWPKWLEFGILSFPDTYRNCWIIDGQHRLYSFAKLNQPSIKIPVLAFVKLEVEKQAQFFVEINKEQKPVDPDLLWDLEGEMRPNSQEGIVSNAVKMLASVPPLERHIYIPLRGKRKRGQLKFSAFCNAIIAMKLTERITRSMTGASKNPIFDNDPKETIKKAGRALSHYFDALNNNLSDPQKNYILFKNTSLEFLIAFYEIILSYLCHVPSNQELQQFTTAISQSLNENYPNESDLKRLLERCASKAGRSEVLKETVIHVRDILNKPKFGQQIGIHGDEKSLSDFERNLAKFIFNKLGIKTEPGLTSRAPKQLRERILLRQTGGPLHEHITLGECIELIFFDDNCQDLKECFLKQRFGFSNQQEVKNALQTISTYRNKVKHGKYQQILYKEPEIANAYVEKIYKCIQEQTIGINI